MIEESKSNPFRELQGLKMFSILLCTLLGITSTVLAQNRVNPITEVEKDNCQNTVEVNYRSQKLTSFDGNITVYFAGILRRIGKKGDRNEGEYCSLSDNRQTPVRTMIIENRGNIQKISQDLSNSGYIVMEPLSFSPDGRYLIVHELNVLKFESYDDHVIFDVKNNYQSLSLRPCEKASYGGDYQGFISENEILFSCGAEYDYEVLNLQYKTIRKVPESFAKSAKTTQLYGTISGEMTVLKRQVFR